MPKSRILIIDDEMYQLEQLRKALAPLATSWEVAFAKNGFDALTQMERTPFDVVVTDLSMPGMDGMQLLAEVARRFPRTIRLLMTDQIERKRIFRSICLAHQFLIKPCQTVDIVAAINRTAQLHHRLTEKTVENIISRIGVLPSIPAIYTRLQSLINNEQSTLTEIAELVEQDIGMSTKILHLINSAIFGMKQEVTRIAQAVPLLGLDTIKSLLAWFQLGAKFSNITQAGLSLADVQEHSMLTARYAQVIATQLGFDRFDADDFFTSGLLHDVGILILAHAFPRKYRDILNIPYDRKRGTTGSELAAFSTTHAEIGARLLTLWGFRNQVVDAVCYHHRPETQAVWTINSVCVVHLAHVFAHEQTPHAPLEAHDEYVAKLGLQPRLADLRAACLRAVNPS